MSDIFDKVSAPRGDVFDRVSASGGDVFDRVSGGTEISPEQMARMEQEWEGGGLEQPWIDPIDAIAGPLGFGRKMVAKSGARAVPRLAAAVAGSLASEPVVGGAIEKADEAVGDAPWYVKTPVNLGTGLVAGGLLTRGARGAAKAVTQGGGAKQGVLRDLFDERFISDAKPNDLAPSTVRAGGEVKLHSNPITEIGKQWEKHIGTPIWDGLVMKRIPQLLEKVPGGEALNKAAIYGYRGDLPSAKKFNAGIEDMRLGQSVGMDYAVDLGNRLQKLPEADQLKIGGYLKGEDVDLGNAAAIGNEAKDALYHLGRQATQYGLLSEETFFKNAGKYMPRLYATKEYPALLKRWGVNPPSGMEMSRFKARKDIPKEIREQMGEILTPGYPVAKGIANLTNDIEFAKFARGIADNPQWAAKKGAESVPDGWVKLEGKKFGDLDGVHVHPEIHAEITHARKALGGGEKVWRKALGAWKYGKVIVSPKTHIRNNISNSLLAHMGGMPVWEQPKWLAKAASEMRNGGEAWEAAKRSGLLSSTYTNKELRGLFDSVSSQMSGDKAGGFAEGLGAVGKMFSGLKAAGRGAANLYEAEEQWFKLAKFMHSVSGGMDARSAAKDAEKWLFNYGKLTRFQDNYRSKWYGAPFATFTFKAIPRIAETAIKTPWRIAGPLAAIAALNEYSRGEIGDTKEQAAAKRKLLPDWMQGGQSMWPRVPITDESGREYYLNMTYILPWGDIAESGGLGGIPGGLMPFSQPITKEAVQQLSNHDWFWKDQIVKDTDVAGLTGGDKLGANLKARLMHAGQTAAPTPIMDIIKGQAALAGKPDYRGRTRNPSVVAADVFGGFKMYPVDYAEQAARQIAAKDPRGAAVARKIYGEIKTLAVKASASEKMGKDRTQYDEQIEQKKKQLIGLAKEAGAIANSYTTSQGE